jgi:hypothetical protein
MLVWLNTVNLHTNQSNARVKSICLFVNLLLMASFTAHAEKNQPFIGDKQKRLDSMRNIPVRLLPYDYYSNHLGFFCKKELQVEKITKLPIRIRLGGLDYVNNLEGKGTGFRQPSNTRPVKN